MLSGQYRGASGQRLPDRSGGHGCVRHGARVAGRGHHRRRACRGLHRARPEPDRCERHCTASRRLRAVLAEHPHVLVIEDDHFAGIATTDYHRVTPPEHPRWALIRSFSKFLGPDLRLAVVAADPHTIKRLETRLAVGATWVSRLLQHIAYQLLIDPSVSELLARAAGAYRERRLLLLETLRRHGTPASAMGTDGLNVWVELYQPAAPIVTSLAARGWAVSDGATYSLTDKPTPALRVTVSTLTPHQATAFADDLADLMAGAR